LKQRDKPQPTAGLLVRRAIASSVKRLAEHEVGAIAGRNDEDVHQARVAVRRLRSYLRTFRALVDSDWSRALRQELRWLGTELGAVRDLDVLIERLRADAARAGGAGDASVKAVLAKVSADRAVARKRLRAALHGDRYRSLRLRLTASARAPRLTLAARLTAMDAFAPIVRACWKRLRATVGDLPSRPSVHALHRVRILAKRLRYATEAAAPADGRAANDFAAAATRLAEVLGELNDAETACRRLRMLRAAPEMALAANAFLALESEASARARAAWPDAWRVLDVKALRAWL
jgi:CHAD domain-containing protein